MNKIFVFLVAFVFSITLVSAAWVGALNNELTNYYTMNESAGNLNDDFGLVNLSNTLGILGVPGIVGDAVRLNGNNAFLNNITNNLLPDPNAWSLSMWFTFNTPASGNSDLISFLNTTGTDKGGWLFERKVGAGNLSLNIFNSSASMAVIETPNMTDVNFNHLVVTYNGSLISVYWNGTLFDSRNFVGYAIPTSPGFRIGCHNKLGCAGRAWNGTIDEVGFWNRTLDSADVSNIYNGGAGSTHNPNAGEIFVDLISPLDNTQTTNSTFNFIANLVSGGGFNITNATLFIWDIEGSIVNNTVFENLSGISNTTDLMLDSISTIGEFEWNILACSSNSSSTDCQFADSNFTLIVGAEIINETFNSPVLETSLQTFIINILVPDGTTVQSADLIYNGTSFPSATKLNTVNNNWTLTQQIIVPSLPQELNSDVFNLSWNITLSVIATGDIFTQQTASTQQNVTALIFNLCGVGGANIPVLNFTMINEVTGIEINAVTNLTTFQATFNLGVDSESLLKNFTINNQSVNSSTFDFCTDNTNTTFFANMVASYGALGFSDSSHILQGAIMNSSFTNEIDLFLLPIDDSVDFFITTKQNQFPLVGAQIQISKFFIGEGVFKTVAIALTDSSGKIAVALELNKEYRFTIIKDGELLGVITKTSICEAAPCELVLTIIDDGGNPLQVFEDFFATGILFNLSYDPLSKFVTFQFVDLTGLATSFTMEVYELSSNSTSALLSNQTVFTSSGTMTFNASALDDGDFRVDVFVSRSPNQFIASLFFTLVEFATALGPLGLFFMLITLMTMIFGFASKPQVLVLVIPLMMTTIRIMGFAIMSPLTITIFWIFGLIAMAVMSK